jgi:hypothetical protein
MSDSLARVPDELKPALRYNPETQREATLREMLHLYVLYACVHFTAHNPAPEAHRTRCVEAQEFLDPGECKKALPKGGALTEKSWHTRRWFECQDTRADSWVRAAANAGVNRAYELEVSAADGNALAALLAPLSSQARATFRPGALARPFQRAFEGPGRWSFFIVGTGRRITAFAVSNLDDFQFTDMATDLSSSIAPGAKERFDFASIAEGAGIELSYGSETSTRAMPPPGGMAAAH